MLQLTIAGRLGRDAEMRSTPAGKSVCGFSVAVDDRRGQEKTTTWVRCSLWDKRGEALAPYLTKGTAVVVVGALSTREYQAKDGATKFEIECNVREITLQGGGGQAQQASQPLTPERRAQVERPRSSAGLAAAREPVPAEFNDDIPF